jgi:hypothetical protein
MKGVEKLEKLGKLGGANDSTLASKPLEVQHRQFEECARKLPGAVLTTFWTATWASEEKEKKLLEGLKKVS